MNRNLVLAVTGASGTAYAIRLGQTMLAAGMHVHLLVSDAARMVSLREIGTELPEQNADSATWIDFLATALGSGPTANWGFKHCDLPANSSLSIHSLRNYSAGIASGSFLTGGMVICPCSMGTLSSIACGASTNLSQRAADVHLKERRPLVLVPRETPLSSIALDNMAKLSQAGATVLPAMPGFYHSPTCLADLVDFVVARICDHLNVPHQLMHRWGDEAEG